MKKTIFVSALFLVTAFTGVSAADKHIADEQWGAGVHNILSSQLPSILLKDIKKEYKGYWITGLYEEGKNRHSSYFITLENADRVIKLSCSDAEKWVVTSTIIKS